MDKAKMIPVEHKKLERFLKDCIGHLENMDKIMDTNSQEKSKFVAKELNQFQFNYHSFLHFGLNIPLEKANNKNIKL